MNIISIGGYNGSGKTTVAKIIQWYLSPTLQDLATLNEYITNKENVITIDTHIFSPWSIKSFSSKVNDSYKLITGVDFNSLNRIQKEIERPKFIQFAETIKNVIGEDVWVNALFKDVNPLFEDTNYIIDDMRSVVEYKYLEQLPNVKFIRINKLCTNCGSWTTHLPTCENRKFNFIELDFYDYDVILQNDGSLNDLIAHIELILKEWKMI